MKRSSSHLALNSGGTNVQEEQAFRQTLNELNQFEQGFIPLTAATTTSPPGRSPLHHLQQQSTSGAHHPHHHAHHPHAHHHHHHQHHPHHNHQHHHSLLSSPTAASLFSQQQQQQQQQMQYFHSPFSTQQSSSSAGASALDLYHEQQQRHQQAMMNSLDPSTNLNYLLASLNAAAAAGVVYGPSPAANVTSNNTNNSNNNSNNNNNNNSNHHGHSGSTSAPSSTTVSPSSSPTSLSNAMNGSSSVTTAYLDGQQASLYRFSSPSDLFQDTNSSDYVNSNSNNNNNSSNNNNSATTATSATGNSNTQASAPSSASQQHFAALYDATARGLSAQSLMATQDSYVDYSGLQSAMGLQISPNAATHLMGATRHMHHPHSHHTLQSLQSLHHHAHHHVKNVTADDILDLASDGGVLVSGASAGSNGGDSNDGLSFHMYSNGGSSASNMNNKSITSLQVWSEFISDTSGGPIVQVNEDQIPATIVGGKSVTKRRRTPLITSMTVDIDKLRQWVEVLITMVMQKNAVMEHAESFLNVCAMHHLFIDLEELKSKVESGHTTEFCDDRWFSEVVLLVNDSEQDNGLESDGGGIAGSTVTAMKSGDGASKKKKKKKKGEDDTRHAYTVKDSPTVESHKHVEFVPLRAKVVSSNKKNCKLRYKVLYDSWFVFQVDSGNTFAINCGKTSKKERKKKFGSSDDLDTPMTGGLSRVSSFGNLSYTSTTSDELKQDQDLFNDEEPDMHPPAQPNFLISPPSGSVSGNYLVFIQFKRNKVMIDGTPEHSFILFGDKPAEIQQIDQNAIFVKVPPGESEGRIQVKIHSGNITISDQDLYFEYTPALPSDSKRKSYEGALVIDERASKRAKESIPSVDIEASSPTSDVDRIVYRREWAIIIAISNYESKTLLASQKECVNDATNLMNILSKEFGFNVCTLFNEQATRGNILKLFESLSENIHKEDCVLVYFVGHSVFKRYSNNHVEGFIAPYDADPDNILNTGISHESFVNTYKCFPAKHICYILDTCYMGRLFKIRTNQDDLQYFRSLPSYARNKAAQVICASGDINDIPLLSEGLFTRHLITALKTMRFKTKSHIISDNTQFSTADQLGQFVQERVIKDSNGRQVPKYGRLEIGDGQLMFIPKSGSHKSPNTELERILSLVCVYEEYLQNMNLGDIHTKESLLQLMKIKFFQNSKFYLDAISNLLSKQTLELRSDFYAHMRLNVTEVYNTAKQSYLGVYSPLEEWMSHKPYQLADVNASLLRNNPNAVVKRIFILERSYRIRSEIINLLKIMEYHKLSGIDVRVVFKDDVEKRKEIPRNFSIIDSRLCHVLYMENDYPKSVLIFNRKTVADMYYSVWVYLHNASITLDEYILKHQPGLMPSEIAPSQPLIQPPTNNSSYKDASRMMSLTDPLLSFESEDNMKSIQHHLNPMLSGFKNVLSSLVSIPPLTELEELSEGSRHTLLEKYQKICKCYESALTTFFSEGKIETNSQFFDRHRVRLHDLESTVEKCYRGCIPVHSWLPYHSQKSSSPYFTFETVNEIADMNKRLLEKNPDLIIERVFVFHQQLFATNKESNVKTQQENMPNVNLHIEKIVQTLNAHEESKVKVFVVILETLDEIQKLLPGTFCIIDNCLVGGTEMRTEQVPIRLSPANISNTSATATTSTPSASSTTSTTAPSATTKTETNIYYVNKLSANPNDVRLKQALWDDMFRKAMTYADFKLFIQNHLNAIQASKAIPATADLTFMEHI